MNRYLPGIVCGLGFGFVNAFFVPNPRLLSYAPEVVCGAVLAVWTPSRRASS